MPADKHVSEMDYTKLRCPKLTGEDAKMILSTRIRVARNIKDFPLGTAISREDRRKIESMVVSVLQSFTGELAGKYYSLSSMNEADRKKLVEDHFLFKGGDKYLQSAGLEHDWPESRGIFHNNDKTFLVWVNEEDQLRIISMENGCDIGSVFKRLSKAAALLEERAPFQHDNHLGYIATCPTNLGTGMRASVHIKLPLLGNNKR